MFSYCPNCKSKKIDFINKQRFTCQQCSFTYYHNVAASTAAIIAHNEQVLLTVRAKDPGKGMLDLPGGFADPNESLEQALSREINEELNISINHWQYLCGLSNSYQYKNITYATMDCFFSCQLSEKPTIAIQESETARFLWVDLHTLDLSKLAFHSSRQALERYISSISSCTS
ncbi:NUDIX hydrolase [Thalassotalea sp. PLHSN55]|uniref:NUDIX hydrolase n=1 Tax=Thalassotalea sp. PLHSN55 TaxID=3435888 RepID=UPI003F847F16